MGAKEEVIESARCKHRCDKSRRGVAARGTSSPSIQWSTRGAGANGRRLPAGLQRLNYVRPHVRGADRLAARRGYVPGAVAVGQGLVHHQFKRGRFLGQTQGIAQHHGYAEDRGDRVGDVLAGDVRGCAVDRPRRNRGFACPIPGPPPSWPTATVPWTRPAPTPHRSKCRRRCSRPL